MRVGFTPAETYNMFRSLRREVFNNFGYEGKISFGVRTGNLFDAGEIAFTSYAMDPDVIDSLPTFDRSATGIRIDGKYLPHLYEDELLNILLHELAHVTAGWHAEHGALWKKHAAEVGAIPHDSFIPRNWRDLWPEGSFFWRHSERYGATMPQWT